MLLIPRRVLYLILAMMLVLLGINLLIERRQSLDNSETSLGVGVDGYKAAYELLARIAFSCRTLVCEAGSCAARSRAVDGYAGLFESGGEAHRH